MDTRLLGEVFALRGPDNVAVWRVRWQGNVCTPMWLARGAAEAYLNLLRLGYRQPEYHERGKEQP